MFILRSLRNPKRYIQIGATPVRIGRSSDNTLVIREKSVSRAHATIQLESRGLVLTDLGSTGGTFVNGVQVKRRKINPGDVISFGTVQWKVEESATSRSMPKGSGLVLSSVNDPGKQIQLTTEGQIKIGRSSINQLRISNKSVSREHALIQFENGKFTVLDKNSSSGTFVNNKRVQHAVLNPGDVVAFGDDQWQVTLTKDIKPMSQPSQPAWQANIGQVNVGRYTLTADPVYGGIVHPVAQGQTPQPHSAQIPVFIRPCHFGALVDRKDEVKTAATSGPKSPVQFYGPAGAGKSTMLCYLSHQPFANIYPDGVIHLLARGRGVLDLLQNIFDAFYAQPAGYIATEDEIRSYLQSKNALILLDDVELDSKETFELIAAAQNCTFILASSKRCLPKGGRIVELSSFETEDSTELFGKVVGRALNTEELSLVKMICNALQNNPGRIIQAASYVRDMRQSIGGVAGVLNVATPIDALNSLIAQSLSEVERFVVAILAVLGGGSIHNRHLPALVGAKNTKGVLDGLMGRGLVRESDGRYSLAGTFVTYLQQEWELSDWADRILEHFSGWVERHQESPEYVLYEIEAILAILTWAVRAGRWQGVLRLCRGVEDLLMIGRQWSAWGTVLQWGLQSAQILGDRAAEAWAFHQLGTRAMCLGDNVTANASLEQAHNIRQSLGDQIGADLARQNQNLLSVSPATPPPVKPAPNFLRPLLLFGGTVAIITTFFWVISHWSTPMPPTPELVSTTITPRRVVATTRPPPEPVSTTITPHQIITDVISPTNTNTFTPTTTRTFTPTGTGTFTPTNTNTFTPTNTNTFTPTKTKTFTPTHTSTFTPKPSIGDAKLSPSQVYYGESNCGSNSVRISVVAKHPAGVSAVVFFRRLHEIGGSKDSGWSSIDSMTNVGGDTFSLAVDGDTLVAGTGFTTSAQVSYQFVIEPKSGDYVRSDVYRDLTLLPCESSPPPPTEPPSPPSTESPYYPVFPVVTVFIPPSYFWDQDSPDIGYILIDPTAIAQNGCGKITTATIKTSVSDVGGVKRVIAYLPGYGEVEMTLIGGNTYQASLGPFSIATNYSVYIQAWDNANNFAQQGPVTLAVQCIK